MSRCILSACVFVVLLIAGCDSHSHNPPAQTPTLSQEQIDAAEKHEKDVSAIEKPHEKLLPHAVYIPREEAEVNDAERAHEAELREAKRAQAAPSSKK